MAEFVQRPLVTEFAQQFLGRGRIKGRHTAAARHAFLIGKCHRLFSCSAQADASRRVSRTPTGR
jgi:hypothetical protein